MIEVVEQEMKRLGETPKIDIDQLEATLGVKLPPEYRYFLERYGDCRIVAAFDCKTMAGTYIEWFHGFRSHGEEDGPTEVHSFDELGIAPEAITIGSDSFGNLIAMFLNDALNGKVYY